MEEKELKELMLKQSEEFRKLYEEHQECEKKLDQFKEKSFLTEEEELEERGLKKKKLALKDKMYLMMTKFKKSL